MNHSDYISDDVYVLGGLITVLHDSLNQYSINASFIVLPHKRTIQADD